MEYVKENMRPQWDAPSAGGEWQGSPGCGCDIPPACPMADPCALGWGLAQYPLAMVYAPCQSFDGLYDPDTALARGTLFSRLDLPLEVISSSSPCLGRCCGKGEKPTVPSGGVL